MTMLPQTRLRIHCIGGGGGNPTRLRQPFKSQYIIYLIVACFQLRSDKDSIHSLH